MIRWDLYNIKQAVAVYLNKNSIDEIDWIGGVVVDDETNTILAWGIDGVDEPSALDLETSWNIGKLNHFKHIQLQKISAQFTHILQTGGNGCTTSILDSNGNPIVVDARRNAIKNDLQNFREGYDFMIRNNLSEMTFVDYYHNFHTVSQEEMLQICNDISDYGIFLYNKKWEYAKEIMEAETLEEVFAVDFKL